MDSAAKDQTQEKKRRGSQDKVEASKNNNETPTRRSPRLSQSEEKVEAEKTEAASDTEKPEKMNVEEKLDEEGSDEDEGSISEEKRKETMESLLMKIGSPKDFNPIALSKCPRDIPREKTRR